jgi:DNA-binding CsgD family transcriptional regulator
MRRAVATDLQQPGSGGHRASQTAVLARQVRPGPPSPATAEPVDAIPDLSPREREIARLVAKGYPNKTVAAILDLSPWTVATYLRRIYAKLGVRSRAGMVSRLFCLGLAP